jgi:uncharacterized protein
MPRPGTQVTIVDGAGPGAASLDTSQAFFVGVAERGPSRAVRVTSLRQYSAAFGERAGGSLLYDSVSAYFTEGGGIAYVSRISGDAAVAATIAFGTYTVDADSPGAWGNRVAIRAEAPATLAETMRADALPQAAGDPVVFVVSFDGTDVERSGVIASDADAVTFGQRSAWVDISGTGAVPAAGTTATLAGGADDNTVDADSVTAALDRFDYALGPGQVLAPGLTTVHEPILAHVDKNKRCAVLDGPDTGDPLALGAVATALYGITGVRFASVWGPWVSYPGPVAPTTVVLPYSAIAAGIIARVDRMGNPNRPAAGADGINRATLGLHSDFTDDEREALNETGVCLAKMVYGDVRSYGFRTAAGPDELNWLWFSNSRTIMAIAHECDAVAETYVLNQIDGRGHVFSRLNKDLRGVCQRYFDMDALYGETPEDAFRVDTGPGVNPVETQALGEIHAIVKVKVSPAAEWVVIEVVKVPIDRAIAA